MSLGTKTVEGTTGALEGVHDVESRDRLPVSVRSVSRGIKHRRKITNLLACSV